MTLRIFNLNVFNPDPTNIAYLQLFDALSTAVTVGSTTPTRVIALPPKGGVDTARSAPICCYSGCLTYAVTSTKNGAGAPTTACILSFDYSS